jgi:lysozyme
MGGVASVSRVHDAANFWFDLRGTFGHLGDSPLHQTTWAHVMFGFRSSPGPATPAPTSRKVAGWVAVIAVAVPLVAGFEGLYTHSYRDSVGVLTVCYGATAADHVDLTRTYTPAECRKMLGDDLPKYDASIKKCLTPSTYAALPVHRHAALVSFVYNVGGGAFCKGSVAKDLNAGHVTAACNDLMRYDRGGGRVIKGLENRREAERKLCLMPN